MQSGTDPVFAKIRGFTPVSARIRGHEPAAHPLKSAPDNPTYPPRSMPMITCTHLPLWKVYDGRIQLHF